MMKTRSKPLLSQALEQQLSAYAVAITAGVGALAAGQVAEADIIFDPAEATLTRTADSTETFTLFEGSGPTLSLRGHSSAGVSFLAFQFTSTTLGANGNAVLQSGTSYAANLGANAPIGGSSRTFASNSAPHDIGFADHFTSSGGVPLGSNNGNFVGTIGFIGFRFEVNGQADYGWARIGESADESQLTIYDAAYQNDGGGILTDAVPEPGTLGLLAGGAAFVAAWRLRASRRREAGAPESPA